MLSECSSIDMKLSKLRTR